MNTREPPLAYEVSAYELAPQFPPGLRAWDRDDFQRELARRVAREKARRELHVYYYRVGHTLAFQLPVAARPSVCELPPGIPGTAGYPWLTWLSWALEERWRVLHAAWRDLRDEAAATLLQGELAALAGWENFLSETGGVTLATGHLAACLALALDNRAGWRPEELGRAIAAARSVIERDVWPWFRKTWNEDAPLTPARLHNIPTIALLRAAQLARVIGHPHAEALERRAAQAVAAWCALRTGAEHHTEGAAYDGYLMDSATEWMEHAPARNDLIATTRPACASLAQQWLHQTLPGRPDLHAPLGDTEPEMPFWITALLRMASWHDWREAAWLARRFPLSRLPAAALTPGQWPFLSRASSPPAAGAREHPGAVTMRTGWDSGDLLAAVGLSRCGTGHLHADSGHVVVGWQGRFWITDPGYQQYRPGPERDFTVGARAHNAPVIGGAAQQARAARLLAAACGPDGTQHMAVELARCYRKLPQQATVRRDIWLVPDGRFVVVRDEFNGLPAGTEVRTCWQGGAHLGWAFRDGWARLGDGERALWLGGRPGRFEAVRLTRHEGSRGPLTLEHVATLPAGRGTQWWIMRCDDAAGWTPPSVSGEDAQVTVTGPGRQDTRTISHESLLKRS
jgi:hypothetical protein